MNISSKNFLITGGTGSFGTTLCKYLLKKNVKSIRIFSRDENKQYQMRKNIKDSRVDFCIGDIRDYESILDAVKGCDYIFHLAGQSMVKESYINPYSTFLTNSLIIKSFSISFSIFFFFSFSTTVFVISLDGCCSVSCFVSILSIFLSGRGIASDLSTLI